MTYMTHPPAKKIPYYLELSEFLLIFANELNIYVELYNKTAYGNITTNIRT